MDEHVNSMSDAYKMYIDAVKAVLAEYNSAGGLRTEATDLAIERLKEQREHLFSACDNAEVFVDTMTQRVGALHVAHHTNVVDPNAAEPLLVTPAFALPREPLSPLLKQQRELESDARYGDAADMSEVYDTAASMQAITKLDLSKPATRETVDQYNAAPQVRNDLDLNKTS